MSPKSYSDGCLNSTSSIRTEFLVETGYRTNPAIRCPFLKSSDEPDHRDIMWTDRLGDPTGVMSSPACQSLFACIYNDFLLHLPVGVIPMQITSKGQVTIPQEVRNRLGLLPHTEVEFEVAGDHARIRKARRTGGSGVRGKNALRALRGSANTRMSTDEIMALTRGGGRPGGHGK